MGLPGDANISIYSKYQKGEKNLITDVQGVTVGHVTLTDEHADIHTGVTAILPHRGNLFQEKVMAGTAVINGFGKSAGLVQIEELGTIESPIILTNTFGVGTGINACVKYMLEQNPEIGVSTGTVNCVVTECNDGSLNDIRGMHVKEEDVLEAIKSAEDIFEEGAVGAGNGMICMGVKGGIGSASRIVICDGKEFVIGALVMSNFGVEGNLRIDGKRISCGEDFCAKMFRNRTFGNIQSKEHGSIIIVLATDIPLNERQLKRAARRASVGLARTGSYLGNGSGDIAIAFSTANKVPHKSHSDILTVQMFHDDGIDKVFEAACEAVEEAIISSMYHAETVKGIRGKTAYCLRTYL